MSNREPTTKPTKYIPHSYGPNAEFNEHARGGVLHLQQCADCGVIRHPPRHHCPDCASPRYAWAPSAGSGSLYSWTVTHRPFDPGWVEDLPYTTAVVELPEGVRLIGALDDVNPGELRLGLPLVADLRPTADNFVFLAFRTVPGRSHE